VWCIDPIEASNVAMRAISMSKQLVQNCTCFGSLCSLNLIQAGFTIYVCSRVQYKLIVQSRSVNLLFFSTPTG